MKTNLQPSKRKGEVLMLLKTKLGWLSPTGPVDEKKVERDHFHQFSGFRYATPDSDRAMNLCTTTAEQAEKIFRAVEADIRSGKLTGR